jgi:formylmethanofuran dehydrogenase subunit C
VSGGLEARLRTPLRQRADFSELLAPGWTALPPSDLARLPVYLEQDGAQALGDLFDLTGQPGETLRFNGGLELVDRLGAGLSQGTVIVEGSVGDEAGVGMSGGVLDIHGNAGARTGAALPGSKRGMLGGELIVRGSAGPETGSFMRRGLLAVARRAGERTGLGMIAGTVIIVGAAGADSGLWSKRGSVVALGSIIPPATYVYACTYRPIHLRVILGRLRAVYGLPIRRQHITGQFSRFSGDFAELGKGEILQWTAK